MNKQSILISIASIAIGVLITLAVINFTKSEINNDTITQDTILGDESSEIELIEYASLGCSHCGNLHKNIFPKIKADLIDTKKIKYVFRAIPTNQSALYGAMLVKCADSDEREGLIENLFKNQEKWVNSPTLGELRSIAENSGIDKDDFYSCIENKDVAANIIAGKKEAAEKYNVHQVPSFVINGEKLEAAANAENIISAINEVAEGKSPNESFKALASEILQVTGSDKVIGKATAPVTIIEYASLSCPHCAKFHTDTFPRIKKDFIDTGKAKFVYRHFPLNAPAMKAAMITECTSKESYSNLLSKLFATQSEWAFDKEYLVKLAKIVKIFGINQTKFDSCLANKDIENKVLQSSQTASSKLGVSSTPTFFINGKKGDHLHSFEEFKRAIESAK